MMEQKLLYLKMAGGRNREVVNLWGVIKFVYMLYVKMKVNS